MRKMGIVIKSLIFTFLIIMLSIAASGEIEVINTDSLSKFAIPIHVLELLLALFISFMSLKFFRITRPLNIFLYVYLALGFFIISTMLYFIFYLRYWISVDLNFANVYIASRLSLLAMLIVFVSIYYKAHKVMRAHVDSTATTIDSVNRKTKK